METKDPVHDGISMKLGKLLLFQRLIFEVTQKSNPDVKAFTHKNPFAVKKILFKFYAWCNVNCGKL